MAVDEQGVADLRTGRLMTVIAAVLGLLGVLIGALGAHYLESYLSGRFSLTPELLAKRMDQFDVGARYHLLHAAALLALCGLPTVSHTSRRIAGVLMVAGIVLFSGSLYLLVATNTPWLGAVTPLGGIAWIAGWAAIAAGAMRTV